MPETDTRGGATSTSSITTDATGTNSGDRGTGVSAVACDTMQSNGCAARALHDGKALPAYYTEQLVVFDSLAYVNM